MNKAQERKNTPVYTGFIKYFPLVFGEVAKASVAGNKQHLDGKPLHWDRTKSKDQLDAGMRHIIDHARGELIDDDGVYHLAKAIWRLSAELELILEYTKQDPERFIIDRNDAGGYKKVQSEIQDGDEYWFVDDEGDIAGDRYGEQARVDTFRKKAGNLFRTREEAEAKLKEINDR